MRKQLITVVLALILIGFIVAGATNIRHTNEKIKLHEIELKSRETKLQELNIKYDQVLEQKTNTEAEKQEQLKKIQELESERQRLQSELQAKRDRNRLEQEKLAEASRKATATPKASAALVTGDKQAWLAASGIPQDQWVYVDYIVSKESSWNPNAVNKSSGACSLVQSLPCSKIGSNWRDPVVALKWQHNYVKARYGGYAQAYTFWKANSWY